MPDAKSQNLAPNAWFVTRSSLMESSLVVGCWSLEVLFSFTLHLNRLAIRQRFFTDKHYRLIRLDAADDFSVRALVEAGLHRNFFGFVIGDREDRRSSLFHNQCFHRHKQRVFFAF